MIEYLSVAAVVLGILTAMYLIWYLSDVFVEMRNNEVMQNVEEYWENHKGKDDNWR